NSIDIFFLVIPFDWWLERRKCQMLNDSVLAILYSPFMLLIAFLQSEKLAVFLANREGGKQDDDAVGEGERMREDDILGEGWFERVEKRVPHIEEDGTSLEAKDLTSNLDEV
ncbi:hypothetical protein HOY80DRAFT_871941, partial [Tuber brumale]